MLQLLSCRGASNPFPSPTAESRRACTRRRLLLRSVATSSGGGGATSKERRRPTDDYHATVKSLNSRGRHVPKKSLGQHYMLNSSINEELSNAANVKEGDVVLEIGPGTGSLTHILLNAGATVIAVEKDSRMAALVKDRFGCTERLKIIQEDITKCHIVSHLAPLLQNCLPGGTEQKLAKVVANIPFNISTEVVKLLLPMGNTFSVVALLLQDEAAIRLVDASIETPEYRSINIFVNFYSDPEYKLKVGRTNFFPQPKEELLGLDVTFGFKMRHMQKRILLKVYNFKVYTRKFLVPVYGKDIDYVKAIVRFKLKQISEYPQVTSPKSFFSMVNSAFSGKRKMLRKSLNHMHPSIEIESALDSIGLPITSRPCELTLDDFVRLHTNLVKP